ncbi:hypothetical protein PIB30_066752 [Stylosanthes scabra]|uniref:RRM domain-containing protein n=1 Tax=Stylosanthes scabra TaxID=79078 RepID=A0ABU6WM62_9FABA|nr:hypothetical protein [Stylosanthes scabra]
MENRYGERSWRDIVAGTNRFNNDARNDVNGGQFQRSRENGKLENANYVTRDKWIEIERRTYSIFVDNLLSHISKRFLFGEFGIHGKVVDVFISRKIRRGKEGVFAFIRFDSKEDAMRAIEVLDGSYISGKHMVVKEARVRKNRVKAQDSTSWRWTRKIDQERTNVEYQKIVEGMMPVTSKEKTKIRREVEVMVAENQKELLNRSILAESFEPIRFGSVVKRLDELQLQYGKIECRDLGPRKCILSLDMIKLRDKAISDAIFQDIIDEVREYWGFKWSHS